MKGRNIVSHNLSGRRLKDFQRVKELLLDRLDDEKLSPQQVLCASMQTTIAVLERGGKIAYDWHDGRTHGKRWRDKRK